MWQKQKWIHIHQSVFKVASCQSAFEISKGYIYIEVLSKLPVVKVFLKSQSDYINQSAFNMLLNDSV